MPRPSTARSRFGVSRLPYESYYPTIPSRVQIQDQILRSNPYAATFAAYDPYAQEDATEAGLARSMMDNFDPDDQEQVTGLQRMIGRGVIPPKQAAAMIAMQRNNDRMRLAQAKAMMPNKTDQALLQKGYSEYVRDISDEEKRAAFKKKAGTEIETDKDWNRAWHMVKDPRQAKFLSDMDAIEKMGGMVPEELQKVRTQIIGTLGPTGASGNVGASGQSPQSTEARPEPQAQIVTVTTQDDYDSLPSGSVYRDSTGKTKRKK